MKVRLVRVHERLLPVEEPAIRRAARLLATTEPSQKFQRVVDMVRVVKYVGLIKF